MSCCRCNRTGSCRTCSCFKDGRKCNSCLPRKLGRCVNSSSSSLCTPVTQAASAPISTTASQSTVTQISTTTKLQSMPTQVNIKTSRLPTPSQSVPATQASATVATITTTNTILQLSQPTINPMPPTPSQSTSNQVSFTQVSATTTTTDTNIQPTAASNHAQEDNCDFTWGSFSGSEMFNAITRIYDEVIHWRHNLFIVPSGNAGKSFVSELARLLQAFADGSSIESVCMKAVTILQVLALQKPSRTSKTRDHIRHLKRRLDLWKELNLDEILLEGRCIQKHLPRPRKGRSHNQLAKSFQKLMSKGKVNKALRLLSQNNSSGVHDVISDTSNGPSHRTT